MPIPRRAVAITVATALLTGAVVALARPSIPIASPAPPATAAVRVTWSDTDAASVARLREIIAAQTGHATSTLGRCGAAMDRASQLHCALAPLALLGASGQLNATMLIRIRQDHPDARCGVLIGSLAGSVGVLGMVARAALRDELPAATGRHDIAATFRTVAALARETRELAADRCWRRACDLAPPASA